MILGNLSDLRVVLALVTWASLPVLVGGVLPLDVPLADRWTVAGAWQLPVGAPELLGVPGAGDEPAFRVNRGVERTGHRVTHQGVDLVNGRSGDPVRAAASGLVALAYDGDNGNGYGGHVVIAHRLEDDRSIYYTVYAHLERGSITVRAGDLVCAGDPVGRVGASGRASTPHLHFEVREPDSLGERWEKAAVLDPIAFVADHAGAPQPALANDDTPGTYMRWAAGEGLLRLPADPETGLTRAKWWRMLGRAAEGGHDRSVADAEALRDSLMEDGVLPEEEAGAPGDEHIAWGELARDLKRLGEIGVRIAHGPLAAADHEAACEARFGLRAPSSHPAALRHRAGEPTAADAAVLLADLSGPRPDAKIAGPEAQLRHRPSQRRRVAAHEAARREKRARKKHRPVKRGST